MNGWNIHLSDISMDLMNHTMKIEKLGTYVRESLTSDTHFHFYDSPGFGTDLSCLLFFYFIFYKIGDRINNTDHLIQIYNDIESRHANYVNVCTNALADEEKYSHDIRIHCCFYFIAPHRFKDIDREFIHKLSDIVAIVPIIAKSDKDILAIWHLVQEKNKKCNGMKIRDFLYVGGYSQYMYSLPDLCTQILSVFWPRLCLLPAVAMTRNDKR